MPEDSSLSEFLVLSRGKWDKEATPEQIQSAIDAFYLWLDQQVAAGKMKTGQRLSAEGRTVSKHLVTDGPFGETKEVIGGYWFVLARSLDEAAALMAGNPTVRLGLFFELRPIEAARASATRRGNETPE
jgi:hypothetical protein